MYTLSHSCPVSSNEIFEYRTSRIHTQYLKYLLNLQLSLNFVSITFQQAARRPHCRTNKSCKYFQKQVTKFPNSASLVWQQQKSTFIFYAPQHRTEITFHCSTRTSPSLLKHDVHCSSIFRANKYKWLFKIIRKQCRLAIKTISIVCSWYSREHCGP